MQLPIKAHYATVAMLALAQQFHSGGLVTARAIADEHDIPGQFLVQILQQLRASGMITSTRGSSGGFRLERAPSTISVADIVEAVCPTSHSTMTSSRSNLNAVVQEVWAELNVTESQQLARLRLDQLCHRAGAATQSMFYI